MFEEDEEWQQSELEKSGINKNIRFEGYDFEKHFAPKRVSEGRNALPMLVAVFLAIALAFVLWKMR